MKKLLSLLAVVSVLICATACNNQTTSSESQTTSATETSAVSGTEATSATEATAESTASSAESSEEVSSAESSEEASAEKFSYVHDPRKNPDAMADIVENPDAVYGFSPNPDSTRLGSYAEYDWTDKEVVEKGRQDRLAYHKSIESMYVMLETMNNEGKSIEEIARAVSEERNRIRLASYDNDPEGLEKVKKSNLETYGNENGPTPESLFEKYGTWEMVMVKAFSVNAGMDACTGLYDDYYQFYIDLGLLTE